MDVLSKTLSDSDELDQIAEKKPKTRNMLIFLIIQIRGVWTPFFGFGV